MCFCSEIDCRFPLIFDSNFPILFAPGHFPLHVEQVSKYGKPEPQNESYIASTNVTWGSFSFSAILNSTEQAALAVKISYMMSIFRSLHALLSCIFFQSPFMPTWLPSCIMSFGKLLFSMEKCPSVVLGLFTA